MRLPLHFGGTKYSPGCRRRLWPPGDWGRPQPRQLESDLPAGQFPWRHSAAPASASGCAHGRAARASTGKSDQRRRYGVPTGMGTFYLLIASMRLHWRGRRVRDAPKPARPHLTRVAPWRLLVGTVLGGAHGAVVYSASESTRASLRPRWRRFTRSGKELTSPLQPRTVSGLQLALAALTSVPIRHRTRLAQPPALEAPSI